MLELFSKDKFTELRREFLNREFSRLNDVQKKAVFKTEGPLLLLAGAGSGKTTVIINRIANIIKYGNAYNSSKIPDSISDMDAEILAEYLKTGDSTLKSAAEAVCALNPAPPWSIIAITFTNKAANELKERLKKAVGDSADDIWAATFHSACVRILRKTIDRIGFSSSFTIYDASDAERVIKDICTELNIDTKMLPPKSVLNVISRAKDSMMSPSDFKAESEGNARLEQVSKIYSKYQARLKDANALDFDDIIMHTVNILRDNDDILDYYRRKFRYILVDEYQDTNHAQYLLVSLLAGERGNICVVGDDDQSIYRFRGATIENILNFEKQFKNAELIRLEQNYRSTSHILNVANSVIKNNQGRKGKELWTDIQNGPLPIIFRAENEREEASYIAENIISRRADGAKFSEFAILYRINAQSMQLEGALQRAGIPYRIVGGMRFFERAEVKDMLSYLCVIANPSDTLRLKRIINVPARKIGGKTVTLIESLALRDGISPYDIILKANDYAEIPSGASSALRTFGDIIESLRKKSHECKLSELYDELMVQSGYSNALILKDDIESKGRLENIMELKSTILEYESRSESPSLSGFLEEVSLYTDLDNLSADEDSVTLMTVHSAKGLEFERVFISGLEEGMFPSMRSLGIDSEIEEERRLFYVASTRAKRELFMTYATLRTMFGQTKYGKKSRFLSEIPSSLCEIQGEEETRSTRSFSESFGDYGFDKTAYTRTTAEFPAPKHYSDSRGISSSSVVSDLKKNQSAAAGETLSPGDRVRHKAFKDGLVVSATPMGGDILLEIAFDNAGTKRLLYKSAAKFITKL
mgnify:CR=1 FL=1